MMPFVRAARLRAAEERLAAVRRQAAEALADADETMVRYMERLVAVSLRAEAAAAHADSEGFRADVAEHEAKRLRGEVADLIAKFAELEAAPLTVYLTFYNGRLHSVHATEDAARAAAENSSTDPAPPGNWTGWAPGPVSGAPTGWSMRRVAVRGLLNGVHDAVADIHGHPAGVHDGGAR